MVKHPFGVNLEDLDFEEVNKEMEADEAAKPIVTHEKNALKGNDLELKIAPIDVAGGDEATTWSAFLFLLLLFYFYFICGAQ